NKGFWMPRDAGCLPDGDISYDTPSRIEPKRPHQWFMDASEPELVCNKKQAIEAVDTRPVSGISKMTISPWESPSSFQAISGQFSDRLFGSATVKTSNLVGRSIQTIDIGNLNMERRGFEDQFGTDSSIGLSMSHAIEDTSFINYGGIRKVVNQARDSEKGMYVSIGHSYSRGDNNTISIGAGYNRIDNNISLGPTYDRGEENTISMAPIFNKTNDNFISMGHTFNKGDGSFVLMGQNYNKGDDNILTMGQPFDKGNDAFISMGHQYEKGKGNVISASPAFHKEQEKFMSMSSSYNKTGENFISVDPSYDKGDHNIVSMRPTPAKADPNVTSMGPAYDKGNSRVLSMGQDYNKGEKTLSFGGFQNEPETNPSGGIITGYDLMTTQPPAQISKAFGLEDSAENNTGPIARVVPEATSKTNAALKSKEEKTQPKKVPPNNFPSNVKSLLSTGMLDGVPVKYFSWSREKNLKGIIKGSGYLCGCEDCKFSKSLNAYEFERHATCKTKHPNSHIYFENGKTIYAVVQELKSTPQEKLFETIQNVTGSPINQKNFRIWKASFQAATRELQRIYGKDEVIMPS
ncbi:Polygalacturonase-1 non-catalytic subunit beta like, partial [Actinidia chinensis var. chinensis]